MGSINENQPEKNREDLRGREAVEKIHELVGKAKNCFFCTSAPTGETGGTRPMNVREVDDEGNLWFLSVGDSHQNHELPPTRRCSCTSRVPRTPTSST